MSDEITEENIFSEYQRLRKEVVLREIVSLYADTAELGKLHRDVVRMKRKLYLFLDGTPDKFRKALLSAAVEEIHQEYCADAGGDTASFIARGSRRECLVMMHEIFGRVG